MARVIAKKVKNAILYEDGTIKIENVRFSYPHVFVPKEGDKGDLSYSLTGLLPKGTHKDAKNLVKEQIQKVIAGSPKHKNVGQNMWFLKDGDMTGKDNNAGMFLVSAREQKRPSVRGKDGTPLSKDDKDVIYGGCWGHMLIRPWAQDNSFGKRINANLIGCQFLRDDEAFGEGRIGEDEIDEVFTSVDDDDSGFDDDEDMGGL
jgi:hypothetical protein